MLERLRSRGKNSRDATEGSGGESAGAEAGALLSTLLLVLLAVALKASRPVWPDGHGGALD
eukprot:6178325-Pleurochrysis_carterae.AAC.5